MTKLILMRHGETAKNIQDVVHQEADQELLTEQGKQQVLSVVDQLQQFMPLVLFCSTEQRAVETAKIISDRLGIPIQLRENLQERNWGRLAGKPWQKIQEQLDTMKLPERFTFVPPGGESWQQFEQRLVTTINPLITEYLNQNILAITHGGAIRALTPIFLHQPRETSFQYDPANASLYVFEIIDQNNATLIEL